MVAKLEQFKESGGYTCVEMRHWFERKTGVLAFNVIIEWSQLIIVMRGQQRKLIRGEEDFVQGDIYYALRVRVRQRQKFAA